MNFKSRHSSSVGFYSLFAYLFSFAAKNSLKSAICISGSTTEVRENFRILGFPIDTLVEVDSVHSAIYTPRIVDLEKKGLIELSEREMVTCACGDIFIPKDVTVARTKKTLVSETLATCCGSRLVSSVFNVLQTAPLDFPKKIMDIAPTVYQKEIIEIEKKFTGSQIVVSRPMATSLTYLASNGQRYYIDQDFINYLSPVIFGEDVQYILGGRNLVKHTIFYNFYNRDFIKRPLEFILLPKIILDQTVSIKELSGLYGQGRVINRLIRAASSSKLKVNVLVSSF